MKRLLLLATLGGYGFSRFRFPGRDAIFVLILATLMIPFQSILNPLFVLLRLLHLQDTRLGLALVYTTFQLPFAVFMMRNAFDAVPREIEEAALLDGCTSLRMLRLVMLPLVGPGMATVGLFAFFGSWNELLAALILFPRRWAAVLAGLPAAIALGLNSDLPAQWVLLGGLMLFGALFAVNSSLHSYLIVSYAKADGVSLDVGFYYMSNALGRLIGTLLSGWVYQAYGLQACLWVSSAFVLLAALISIGLPRHRASSLME